MPNDFEILGILGEKTMGDNFMVKKKLYNVGIYIFLERRFLYRPIRVSQSKRTISANSEILHHTRSDRLTF